jgi:hypothetical protein
MNFVIYDTEHFETTYALIRLLENHGNKITVFTNEKTGEVVKGMLKEDAGKIAWVIRKKNNFSFVLDLYRYCKKNKTSWLFLNTVSFHHALFAALCFALKKTHTVLTIHAVNSFFSPKTGLTFKSYIRFSGQRWLSKTVSGYAVLLTSIAKYMTETYSIRKPVYCLPGGVYEGGTAVSNEIVEADLHLVVPGSIDEHRRDYAQVLELAFQLEARQRKTRISLLGAAKGEYGKEIIESCKRASLRFVDFHFYPGDFVDEKEYEKQLTGCDFVFIPLKDKFLKQDGREEEYGLTICSGSFFDAVRFAKPMIVPAYIEMSKELQPQCIPYTSLKNLADMLATATKVQRENYASVAAANSRNFSVEAIRPTLPFLK